MLFKFILCLLLHSVVFCSAVPNFERFERSENVVFFLSIPRSGTNVITGSLVAITRKPISWINWERQDQAKYPAYNRLHLPLVTEEPLLYRTHFAFDELRQVVSEKNKLILLARNPKELLFRAFSLVSSTSDLPDMLFIKKFFELYLEAFRVYDAWCKTTRKLVYYEDFIQQDEQLLLGLLDFMDERPLFIEDFKLHKAEYMAELHKSYEKQHKKNYGGLSSLKGPQAIYYTKDVDVDFLKEIDAYLKKTEPVIWQRYLKRFATHSGI